MCCFRDLATEAESLTDEALVDLLSGLAAIDYAGEFSQCRCADDELDNLIQDIQDLVLERMDAKNGNHEGNKTTLGKLVEVARSEDIFQESGATINYCGRRSDILGILSAVSAVATYV